MRKFNPWLIGAFVGALIAAANAQNSSVFPSGSGGGLTNFTSNGTTLSGSGQTVTANQPILDLTQTWNNAGVAFDGLRATFTETAAAGGGAPSMLIHIKAGTTGTTDVLQFTNQGQLMLKGGSGANTGTSGIAPGQFNGELALNPAFGNAFQGATIYLDGNNGWAQMANTQPFGWTNAANNTSSSTVDTFIGRGGAAATFMLGRQDAAAPVAQTFQVQSVVAGTTNTAGANWNITGSKGTGTGAGGNIIFNTAPPGTTGTAQNTTIQTEVIDSNGHIRVGNQTAPALTTCGTTPAIVGDDTAGTVTMGTGTPTGCTITFHTAYANIPICVVVWPAQILASQSYTVSTTAITLTQTATSSNKVNYICRAQNAG
jgi:hypothetical protein